MKVKFKQWKIPLFAILVLVIFSVLPFSSTACIHTIKTEAQLQRSAQILFINTVDAYREQVKNMTNEELIKQLCVLNDELKRLNNEAYGGLDEYVQENMLDITAKKDLSILKKGKTLQDVYDFLVSKNNINFYPSWKKFRKEIKRGDITSFSLSVYVNRVLNSMLQLYRAFRSAFVYCRTIEVLDKYIQTYFINNKNSFIDLNSSETKLVTSSLLQINWIRSLVMSILFISDDEKNSKKILHKSITVFDNPLIKTDFVVLAEYIKKIENKFVQIYTSVTDKYKLVNEIFFKKANELINETDVWLIPFPIVVFANPSQTKLIFKSPPNTDEFEQEDEINIFLNRRNDLQMITTTK